MALGEIERVTSYGVLSEVLARISGRGPRFRRDTAAYIQSIVADPASFTVVTVTSERFNRVLENAHSDHSQRREHHSRAMPRVRRAARRGRMALRKGWCDMLAKDSETAKRVTIRGKSGAELLVKPAKGGEDGLAWLLRISDEIVSQETRELVAKLPPGVFDRPACYACLGDSPDESQAE